MKLSLSSSSCQFCPCQTFDLTFSSILIEPSREFSHHESSFQFDREMYIRIIVKRSQDHSYAKSLMTYRSFCRPTVVAMVEVLLEIRSKVANGQVLRKKQTARYFLTFEKKLHDPKRMLRVYNRMVEGLISLYLRICQALTSKTCRSSALSS